MPYLGIGPDGLPALGTSVSAELLKALDAAVASLLLHILLPMQRGAAIVAVKAFRHGAHGVAAGTCSGEDNMAELKTAGSLGHPNGALCKPSQEAKTTVDPVLMKGPVQVGKPSHRLFLAYLPPFLVCSRDDIMRRSFKSLVLQLVGHLSPQPQTPPHPTATL